MYLYLPTIYVVEWWPRLYTNKQGFLELVAFFLLMAASLSATRVALKVDSD